MRKEHGSNGDFDVDLPLTGETGIESRIGIGGNRIVFTFDQNVTGAGSAIPSAGGWGRSELIPPIHIAYLSDWTNRTATNPS